MRDDRLPSQFPRTGVTPGVGATPTGPRPGRPRGNRRHAAAGTRRVTLIASIAAALGLTAVIGTQTVTTSAGASDGPATEAPTVDAPTTTTTHARRYSTTPTSAPRRWATTTTTEPTYEFSPTPQTRTRGS